MDEATIELEKSEMDIILRLIEFIKKTPFGEVTLVIHTDNTGTKNVQMVLGKKSVFKLNEKKYERELF